MSEPEIYAERYSSSERCRLLLLYVCVASAFYIGFKVWVLPWLNFYLNHADCLNPERSSAAVFWAGFFVGVPIFGSLVVAVMTVRQGLAVLAQGRYPARGQKALWRSRVLYGSAASIRGTLLVLAPYLFLLMTIGAGLELSKQSVAPRSAQEAACQQQHPTMLGGR
ncbi:hypothetical protein [Pseudomonas mangiferae]|uniref:Transmembrane protein n=1 Tax=Pseudomonas mangiferae TaxID=2593654 RepID=A0A553H181_9PSED|nr:hypothetical protein [Pseudomonas mangiferae]TRX75506.1 hypothetical protein FM069_07125 [Pseudomonas mangiferae]